MHQIHINGMNHRERDEKPQCQLADTAYWYLTLSPIQSCLQLQTWFVWLAHFQDYM